MNNLPEIRLTKQREVILEELCKLRNHPTADQIYDIVRQRLPRISLGTIYRNLEMMARDGAIQRLDLAGQRRYDGNADDHAHLECLKCGDIHDLPIDIPSLPLSDAAKAALDGFEITGYRICFLGFCPACRADSLSGSEGSHG